MKFAKRKWILLAILAVIAAAGSLPVIRTVSGRKELTLEERLKELLPVTVTLRLPGGEGCGIIWKLDGASVTVLTAAHVAGSVQTGDLITAGGVQELTVEDCYISPEFDLAFVRILWQPVPDAYREIRTDTEKFDALKTGDKIYAAGNTNGAPQLLEGKILDHWIYMEDFGYHMLWGEMHLAEAGWSGSGIFDENGVFAGILCGGTADGEIAVLPLSVILTEWKNIDIP